MVTFGEKIWTALQIETWCHLLSPISVAGFNESLSEVCLESVRSMTGVFLESDGNQIWRADLNSSPN